MTSKVVVSAHCADTKCVVVTIKNAGTIIEQRRLQNGETTEVLIYDERSVETQETLKPEPDEPEVEVAE